MRWSGVKDKKEDERVTENEEEDSHWTLDKGWKVIEGEQRTNDQRDCGPPPLQKNPDSFFADFLSRVSQILPGLPEDFVYVFRFSVDSLVGFGLEI